MAFFLKTDVIHVSL